MKNKLLTLALSVAIAFGLWLYVITVVSPGYENTYYNIPVVIQNESLLTERGLIITKNENATVNLHLTGNRVDLNKLNSANITVSVDASKIYEARRQSVSYTITYPGDITENAISAQKIPGTVWLQVEELVSKSVDVMVEYPNQVPEGYTCDKENAVLSAESIQISGPKSVIDKMAFAKITVDLAGQTQTISQDYSFTLCDTNGVPVDYNEDLVQTNLDQVNITVKIQRLMEIPLVLNVVPGGGATIETSDIKMSLNTIWISGSENQLKDMTQIVLDPINLAELREETNIVVLPIKLPEGVTNESGETEVTVEIKFPALATKTVTVTKFVAENVPAGMSVSWITKSMQVQIRGPKTQINAIKDEDVIAVVDFSGEQAGNVSKSARFTFGSYTDVGAINPPNVTAKLKG